MTTRKAAHRWSKFEIRFLATNFAAFTVALLPALAATVAHGQTSPQVSVQKTVDGSNTLVQLATDPGWFYTLQQSTNLTVSNWGYAADLFAGDVSLTFTNPVGSNDSQRFFRVSVNPPNPGATTNIYHSWSNVVSVNNGIVEAIIVPTIGRVQQFRFLGDTNNPAFFEDSTLFGQSPSSTTYKGWGADKAWPAPQNSWSPTWPPANFDRMTNAVTLSNGIVTMQSQVDSRFGIRTTRIVELLFSEPTMRIRTIFERMATPSPSSLLNSNLAVWIDCQVNVSTNSRVYVPVPSPSIFANGYTLTGDAFFGPTLPPSYAQSNGVISFGPDTAASHKVGFDSGMMVLVGTNISLRIDAPRVPGATYTAGGCSVEVYTAQYSASSPFFELESLSPAPPMAVGDTREFVTTYSLFHRSQPTTDVEAQQILQWHY